MAKGAYIGVSGKARKVKKIYIGVSSVARKVKKAYIGVDGKARLCYSGLELRYVGTSSNLNTVNDSGFRDAGATTLGNYVIVAGGEYGNGMSNYSKWVFAADSKSYTSQRLSDLSSGRCSIPSVTVGKYAVFGGGLASGMTARTAVNVYNDSLTSVESTDGGVFFRCASAVANINENCAMFFGGGHQSTSDYSSEILTIDSSLTKTTHTPNPAVRVARAAGGSLNGYAIFSGGREHCADGSYQFLKTAFAYNSSFTRISMTNMSVTRYTHNAASAGNTIIFGAGMLNSNNVLNYSYTTAVDAYNGSLTKVPAPAFDIIRRQSSSATLGDYAIFYAGDTMPGATPQKTADVYDASLTKIPNIAGATATYNCKGTSNKERAFFVGGWCSGSVNSSAAFNSMEVFTIS